MSDLLVKETKPVDVKALKREVDDLLYRHYRSFSEVAAWWERKHGHLSRLCRDRSSAVGVSPKVLVEDSDFNMVVVHSWITMIFNNR